MTIFLDVVTIDVRTLEPIRSSTTNRVLAHTGKEGIYLWDRLSSNRHVLTWEHLLECYQQYHGELPAACEHGTIAS